MRLRSGEKHHLRKSADRKAQIRKAFVAVTGLICAFRSADFLRWCFSPEQNLTHNLFFLFPIVFGINQYTINPVPECLPVDKNAEGVLKPEPQARVLPRPGHFYPPVNTRCEGFHMLYLYYTLFMARRQCKGIGWEGCVM